MKQNMKFSLKLMFHTAAIKNFCLIITFMDGKSAEEEGRREEEILSDTSEIT